MRIVSRIVLVAVVLGLLVLGTVFVYAYQLRGEARSVLDDVLALTTAPDRSVAFVALKQKYGNKWRTADGWPTGTQYYELTVSNHCFPPFFGRGTQNST